MDLVLSEHPYAVARSFTDDADLWTSHFYGQQTPDDQGPKLEYPLQRQSETANDDPRFGSWHLQNVAAAQRLRIGPQLIHWTAWNGETEDVTSTDIPEVSTASSSFVRLWDQVATGYDADEPGWSVCNFARGYDENHPYWASNNGSIPVLVAVYGSALQSGVAATVRVQTSAQSWVDCPISYTGSPAYSWFLAYGHLEVGTGPGDDKVCQAFFRRESGAANPGVRSMCVYAMRNYVPAGP